MDERPPTGRWGNRVVALAGGLLLGQGVLVVSGVLDHEVPYAMGLLLVGAGVGLLSLRGLRLPSRGREWPMASARAVAVGLLGAFAAGGVLTYNLLAGSTLGAPEWALLAYGLLLLAAAPRLRGRVAGVPVGTLVAYSFPLFLAPFGLYALNALLAAHGEGGPFGWYVDRLLVAPLAGGLGLAGLEASATGSTVRVETPRGPLFLTVGMVCAGLYAAVLFLGVFALFAWEAGMAPRRLLPYLAVGLAGLHAANVARLLLLALVGYAWGGERLQAAHRHAGWVFFLAWSLAYWALVLRRFEPRPPPGRAARETGGA